MLGKKPRRAGRQREKSQSKMVMLSALRRTSQAASTTICAGSTLRALLKDRPYAIQHPNNQVNDPEQNNVRRADWPVPSVSEVKAQERSHTSEQRGVNSELANVGGDK